MVPPHHPSPRIQGTYPRQGTPSIQPSAPVFRIFRYCTVTPWGGKGAVVSGVL